MISRSLLTITAGLAFIIPVPLQSQSHSIATDYRAVADSLIRGATGDSSAYTRLGVLVDRFGHRLSGSPSLEAAIDWILAEMKKDGLQNVRGEPVSVPNWQRGEESAELVKPRRDSARDAGARRQRRHAGRRDHGARPRGLQLRRTGAAALRGEGQDRAVRRALHHLSGDPPLSDRWPFRRRAEPGPWPASFARSPPIRSEVRTPVAPTTTRLSLVFPPRRSASRTR